MKIKEFMQLPDSEKEKYIVKVDDNEYDIGIFTPYDELPCELCEGDNTNGVIGTSDSREPKFCMKHYAEINKEGEFVKNEIINYMESE